MIFKKALPCMLESSYCLVQVLTSKAHLIISNPSSNHSTLIWCGNDFWKTLLSSCLVQILGLVSRCQSIFFVRVGGFPYMKGSSSSAYLDCWGLTRACKALRSQHSRQLQYQKPRIACVCCHWHLPLRVYLQEINQWISSKELKMIRVVGRESTTRNYSMKFTFITWIVYCPPIIKKYRTRKSRLVSWSRFQNLSWIVWINRDNKNWKLLINVMKHQNLMFYFVLVCIA
jgi:hypothetical protein